MKVLITGMGIVSAAGNNAADFTTSLKEGRSGVASFEIPPLPTTIMAGLQDFDFKAILDGLVVPEAHIKKAYKAARRAPIALKAALIAALEACQASQLFDSTVARNRVSLVAAGQNINQNYQHTLYNKFQSSPDFISPNYAIHFMDTDHIGMLSEILDVQGEGFTVGGASASGNLGLIQAYRHIKYGLSDICIVLGAMADLSPVEIQAFRGIGAMGGDSFHDAPAKACRPFDEKHEGFIYGQASACLILESEASAKGREVSVLGELAGGAIKLDSNRLPNPGQAGEQYVMQRVLQEAGLSPEDIDYINTHGTSSAMGDKTEIAAIKEVFQSSLPGLWMNATKSITGHCLWSAGVVEAIATLIQMNGGFVHPNPNLDDPIDKSCNFVGKESLPATIRAALSNSFGFGGINSAILLKQYTDN